jgi:hypothetical protein
MEDTSITLLISRRPSTVYTERLVGKSLDRYPSPVVIIPKITFLRYLNNKTFCLVFMDLILFPDVVELKTDAFRSLILKTSLSSA